MEPQQQAAQQQAALERGRFAALSEKIKELHPAGVQYWYNGQESAGGIYILAPFVYSLVVRTLSLKFASDGKWHGDFKINRHTNPYYAHKPIKAELTLNQSEMRVTINKDIYLYIPLGKTATGKKVAKAIKARQPETYAQMQIAHSVSNMLDMLKDKTAEIYELPIDEQLAIYSQAFHQAAENMILFGIIGYPELTPAYIKQYNADMIATKQAQLDKLKEEREAQQAQALAGQAGDASDGSSSPNDDKEDK